MTFKERYQYNPATDFLGKGGFARVYKAHDTNLDIEVAVKFFNATEAGAGKYTVYEEIKRGIKLNHPNILRYFDAAILENTNSVGEREVIQVGIMEVANGGDLKQFVRKHPGSPELLRLLKEVLGGLDYLHRQGLIHRDLKPQNILLTHQEGIYTAKLSDFGISKALDSSGISSSKAIGTIEYMAPEQFNPQKYGINGEIGTNLDLWSFGVMVYELVAGEPLFGQRSGNTSAEQIMSSILSPELPDSIHRLPEPYRSIVRKCLVHHAADRVQRGSELIRLMEGVAVTNVADSGSVDTLILPKMKSPEPEVVESKREPRPVPTKPRNVKGWLVGLILLVVLLAGYRFVIYQPGYETEYGTEAPNYRFYLIAMATGILLWGVGYLYVLLFFLQTYTIGLLPKRLNRDKPVKNRVASLLIFCALAPLIGGGAYRIGGILEANSGIAWGCYLEYFQLGAVFFFFWGFVGTLVVWLVALLKPGTLGIPTRKRASLLFLLFNVAAFSWTFYITRLVPILAGPLSGKESSCL